MAGFSGGLDSTVLLHLLAADARVRHAGLRAIHVHHGLHPDADDWAARCQALCDALAVPLTVVRVAVERNSKLGVEGAARAARHTAFAQALGDGDILALAHHQDDQAETFLLRALRGSGVDGLAAMRRWRRHGHGWLWRPLLDLPRAALLDWARSKQLEWIDDPGNAEDGFDRNFLRHRVVPLLRQRWPQADAALARSATLSAEAADLLAAEDGAALTAVSTAPATLAVDALLALPGERRARVLRRWVDGLGLPPLPATGLRMIESRLLHARADAQPRFDWSSARIERWRNLLHATLRPAPWPPDWTQVWDGSAPLRLPDGGQLALVGAAGFDAPLQVRGRHGGERLTLPGRRHSHALKHLLQDAGLPPWHRAALPLLVAADGELLAAGDRILSARMQAWLTASGARLRWSPLA